MPTARTNLSTSAVNGRVYAIGGRLGNNSLFSTVEEYDPATDTWTPKAGMPTARTMLTTSVLNGKIYAIGGSISIGGPQPVATVEAYDPYPITVDFNGDGIVDIDDLVLLIEHWGQDNPMYDLAPPYGDGVVDVRDLEVLMSYWGQDVSFIAHWKLDETGGDVAYDSVADNDAAVMGDALWQREGGHVDGAIQFDGVSSYLSAPFILDPAEQPFSVFTWIKGGQPGQAIISQHNGFGEWLSLDAAGSLISTLTFPLPAVTSDVVITDDLWHRVGLVSDGSGMSLYVDDIEVARSETSPVLPAYGDLQIGTGNIREPGTFWSGLIDDVRIYDRVVAP